MRKTSTHRLADILLGQPLIDFVASRRREGIAWRLISRELYDRTDGEIDVTAETLRSWFGQAQRVA